MDYTSIDTYLSKLHFADVYKQLTPELKESAVFTATELLKDNYDESMLTERAVSLQVLFMLEGEAEGFSKLKRHGIKEYSNKGVSAVFSGDEIAPSVIKLLASSSSGAKVGRLI